jgi:hypothetical protein
VGVEAAVEVVVVVVRSAVCVWWRAIAVLWRRRRWLTRPLGNGGGLGPCFDLSGGKLVPGGAVLGGRFLALALRVLGADEHEVQHPDLLRVFVRRGL